MIKKWKTVKNIINSVSKTTPVKTEQKVVISTPVAKPVKIEESLNHPESYLLRYQNIYSGEPSREEQTYMPSLPWFHYYAYPPMMSQEFMGFGSGPYPGNSMYAGLNEVKEEYEEVKE